MLLLKGFEIEIFTGTPQGEIVGLSDEIVANLDGFQQEIDRRFVEYTTAPNRCYEQLLFELIKSRKQLRFFLQGLGDYSPMPGSTLSLSGSNRFDNSDPSNSYYNFLEQTHGTKIVTTSIHINIGIEDPELLMRAIRLVRVEAPLYLSLSAASPFLDGVATGYHSTRWQMFPKTPTFVPLFETHAHFIDWTNAQLQAGTMQNLRHLWCSVRPNGDLRPYYLNRLELRICDLITDPMMLLAVTALLEARLWRLMADPKLDPLVSSRFSATDLIVLTQENEQLAAERSLDAQLRHWQDGRSILARDWIAQILREALAIAKQRGFSYFLEPLIKILSQGNTAQQWLALHNKGINCQDVLKRAIAQMAQQEQELESKFIQRYKRVEFSKIR